MIQLPLLVSAFPLLPAEALSPSLPTQALIPVSASSADEITDSHFSYTYVELGATRFDTEVLDDKADTYYAEASISFLGCMNVFANYENLSSDVNNTDTDLWTLGLGAHFGVGPKLDLNADIAALLSKLDSDTVSEDSEGWRLRAGLRWMAFDSSGLDLEFFGHAMAISLEDSIYSEDSVIGFDGGVRAHMFEFLSVGATYTYLQDEDSIGVSARVSF